MLLVLLLFRFAIDIMPVLDVIPRRQECIHIVAELALGLATLTNRHGLPEQSFRGVGATKRFAKRMGKCIRHQRGIDVVETALQKAWRSTTCACNGQDGSQRGFYMLPLDQ